MMRDQRRGPPDILLLGPIRVRTGAVEHAITGDKQRMLLAQLVLSSGRPMSVSRLADDLWDDPPRDVAHAVQAHVSRLRSTLQVDIDFIEGAGYRLQSHLFECDVMRFSTLCEAARAQLAEGDRSEAVRIFDEALELWRGPALGDLADTEALWSQARRLEEARQLAARDRIDAVMHGDLSDTAMDEVNAHTVVAGPRETVLAHAEGLPQRVLSLLRHAAVIGATFELMTLAEITSADRAELDHMVEAAKRAQLLEPDRDGVLRHRFRHDLIRTVLYDSIPPLERAQLHSRIAEATESRVPYDRMAHHLELAHHFRQSDRADAVGEAAGHIQLAAQDALERGDSVQAAALFSEALQMLGARSEPAQRCDLLIGLGSAQFRCSEMQYRATLLEACRLAIALGDKSRLIAAVLANYRGWWSSTAEIDHERVASIETALAMCDSRDVVMRSHLLSTWAQENVRDPSCRAEVLKNSSEALTLAEDGDDAEALATALASRFSVLYALFEQPAECVRISRRLLELSHLHGDRMMRLSAALCLAQASMRFGDFDVADRYVGEAVQLAEALHHPPRLWLARSWQAMREAMRGRMDTAEIMATETLHFGMQSGEADASPWFAGQLFTIRMLQDRLPEIVDDVRDEVATMADAVPAWRAALAVALARSDQHADAEEILDDFASGSFEHMRRDIMWLNGMCYLSMTCEALDRADVASSVYGELLPYRGMVANNGTIDAGPVDLQLGALARVMGRHDLAEDHLVRAATLCRDIGSPVWLAQVSQRQPQSPRDTTTRAHPDR